MNSLKLTITPLSEDHAPLLSALFKQIGWDKPVSLFTQYLTEQDEGIRNAFVGKINNELVGYSTILWQSEHLYFNQRNIPEIKDLNILPQYRQQGFGKALLEYAEHQISLRSPLAGIGVGITLDYGAAQILYTKMGYVPNGEGATHHEQSLKYGENVKIDDDTVLWLIKKVK